MSHNSTIRANIDASSLDSTQLMSKIKNVALLLINNNNEILAVSRKHDHELFGLPGGKIEQGEFPTMALEREVMEEVGLTLDWDLLEKVFIPNTKPHTATFVFTVDERQETSSNEPHVITWLPDWNKLLDGPFGDYNLLLYENVYNLYHNS